MKIQSEFANQKFDSANMPKTSKFRNQNSTLKIRKTSKIINKCDRIKKSINDWSHFEKVTYARLLLQCLVRNIMIDQNFLQMLSEKINKSQTQIIKYHCKMIRQHKTIASIVIYFIGYKITNRGYSSIKDLEISDRTSHYNQVQQMQRELDTIFLGQDEQQYLQKVLMIEKSPEFYEVNMQQSLIEVFDLDFDYQLEEDDMIVRERGLLQQYKYSCCQSQDSLFYIYS